jgi:hypothetical protein
VALMPDYTGKDISMEYDAVPFAGTGGMTALIHGLA